MLLRSSRGVEVSLFDGSNADSHFVARSNSKCQPPKCTYWREEKETKMRKSRGEDRQIVNMVSQHQGAAIKGFQLVLGFDASMHWRTAGESDGDEFCFPQEGDGSGGRQVRKENVGTNAEICKEDAGHFEEIRCREEKKNQKK